jgi:hypothetical protein
VDRKNVPSPATLPLSSGPIAEPAPNNPPDHPLLQEAIRAASASAAPGLAVQAARWARPGPRAVAKFSVALCNLAVFSRSSTPAGLSRPTKIFDLDDKLGSPPMHPPEDVRRAERLVRGGGASSGISVAASGCVALEEGAGRKLRARRPDG